MYRILTEDKNQKTIKTILHKYVDGFTVLTAVGSWKGIPEKSLAIDLVDADFPTTEAIAQEIKDANQQDAVLILEIPTRAVYV